MRLFRPFPSLARYAFIAIVSTFIFLVLPPTVSRAAFGISPPFLNTDHLVPGVTYQQTVYLVQDQPNTDLGVHADLTVPDAIKSWIKIDKGFDFVIPAGTRQFPVVVSVTVPKDAALAKYTGNLVFATQPKTGGQVAISLGANVAINLTVGNNVYESYKVPLITLPDIEEGWNPRAAIRFQNDGNIPETPDRATFDLYDHFDAVRLDYLTKEGGFPTVPPFTTKEYTIEFPTSFHLGVGDYWGSVVLYKDNQVIGTQRTIFHVLPAGSLSPWSKIINLIQGNWIVIVLAVIILVLLASRLRGRGHGRRKTAAHA